MPSDPLPAHSLAEAFLYVMVTPCPACGNGPLRAADGRPVSADADNMVLLPVTCAKCAHISQWTFVLDVAPIAEAGESATINATDEPSRIIDLVQWITLAHVIIEAASREGEKQKARHLGIEAAQCLEEALKFYGQDNDLPESDAFFSDASRKKMSEQPQSFSRQRLVHLRSKLPAMTVMRSRLNPATPKKKRWWFW